MLCNIYTFTKQEKARNYMKEASELILIQLILRHLIYCDSDIPMAVLEIFHFGHGSFIDEPAGYDRLSSWRHDVM